MTSGRYSSVADVTAKQSPGGQGMSMSFFYPLCGNKRACLGRRLKRVHGLRQWVCAGCAGKGAA